jgi:hypothetical protein
MKRWRFQWWVVSVVGHTWYGHVLERDGEHQDADSQLQGLFSNKFKLTGPFIIGNTTDIVGIFQVIKWLGL